MEYEQWFSWGDRIKDCFNFFFKTYFLNFLGLIDYRCYGGWTDRRFKINGVRWCDFIIREDLFYPSQFPKLGRRHRPLTLQLGSHPTKSYVGLRRHQCTPRAHTDSRTPVHTFD